MYKVEYRKRSNRHLSLGIVRGYKENGKIKITRIVLDPVLKKKEFSKIRKEIINHERVSAKLVSNGMGDKEAHKIALKQEPKWFNKMRKNYGLYKAVGLY